MLLNLILDVLKQFISMMIPARILITHVSTFHYHLIDTNDMVFVGKTYYFYVKLYIVNRFMEVK